MACIVFGIKFNIKNIVGHICLLLKFDSIVVDSNKRDTEFVYSGSTIRLTSGTNMFAISTKVDLKVVIGRTLINKVKLH